MYLALPIFILFAVVSNAQVVDTNTFSLFMTGTCKEDSATAGNCTLKGNSQTITTLISSTDAIKFSVKNHIGSFAQITAKYTTGANGEIREIGAITFGTHKSREHTLLYSVSGKVKAGNNGVEWIASSGTITGGLGVYQGYEGIITIAGGYENEKAYGLVSGHIWKKQ